MKKFRLINFAVLWMAVMILTACQSGEDASSSGTTKTAEPKTVFGDFQTQTLDGEPADQEIFGQAYLTMVNVWATFCGPCINEMPDLGELSRSYDPSEFQIVGLISDVTEAEDEDARKIVSDTQADYVHLVASEDLMTGALQKINVVPTTIFVDQDGMQVGDVYAGAKSMEAWKEIIDGYLKEVQE